MPQNWYFTPKGLDELKSYSNILGFPKNYLITGIEDAWNGYDFGQGPSKDIQALGGYLTKDNLLSELHSRHLRGSGFTFRNHREDPIIDSNFYGDFEAEYEYFFNLGLDSVFSEKQGPVQCARRRFQEKLDQITPGCDDATPWKIACGALGALCFIMTIRILLYMRENRPTKYGIPLESGAF